MNTGPREWDAEVYDRISDPQAEWAQEVVERLDPQPPETILDAGCGSGRVTEELVKRAGRVIGVDASQDMIEKARERLGQEADLRLADLAELDLGEQVDAIFSNAVFHWIFDHDRLFARLYDTLAPGGRLVAQCGAKGNVAALVQVIIEVAADERFGRHFRDFEGGWNFATPEETTVRLEAAGFEDVRCWTQKKIVERDEPREFLRVVTLGQHLALLPEELQDPFVDAVAERMGAPLRLEYMRLNIDAHKPA